MRLACVTNYAVLDQAGWARSWPGMGGVGFHLTRALERLGVRIDYVGPLTQRRPLLGRLRALLYGRLLEQTYYSWAEPAVARSYADQAARGLAGLPGDLVFCPENALPIAYLDCKRPIVLSTDAPFIALIDYYSYLTGLCWRTRQALERLEAAALGRCAAVLYSSEWAADAAIRHYRLERDRVSVVPWGANLDGSPTFDEVRALVDRRPTDRCKLLFVGMWWHRKGGDVAVEIARRLNASGLPTELTLVGCDPPAAEPRPDFVKQLGFLDKSIPPERRALERAFADSHFLILPTRADCTPLVVAEANAFGVPCLAANTGGLAALIREGENGKLYPPGSDAAAYCADVSAFMRDRRAYRELALAAYGQFEGRLNWTVAARATCEILARVL